MSCLRQNVGHPFQWLPPCIRGVGEAEGNALPTPPSTHPWPDPSAAMPASAASLQGDLESIILHETITQLDNTLKCIVSCHCSPGLRENYLRYRILLCAFSGEFRSVSLPRSEADCGFFLLNTNHGMLIILPDINPHLPWSGIEFTNHTHGKCSTL